MNIAFDIDGVLNDIEKFQLEYGVKYFKEKYIKEYYYKHGIILKETDIKDSDLIIDPNGYGIKEIFNCSPEEEVDFWTKYTFKFFFENAREDVKETIKKLRLQGNKIFIVSSRALTTENSIKGKIMRTLVEKWLKREDIEYDEIIYCSIKNSDREKAEVCSKYGIDIFVEDKKENIKAISEVTNVICINNRNNKGIENPNITCVDNFKDVYKEVKKIQLNGLTFRELTREERNNLSHEELIDYYKNLKEYYLSLPFNEDLMLKYREQCRNAIKNLLFFFNAIYSPQIINKNKLPTETGVILASNHLHSFDPLLIVNLLEEKGFRLLAKEELLGKYGNLFEYIGSIFVDNDDDFSKKESKEELIKTLLHGGNVMHFPEGTRNKKKYERFLLDFKYGTVDVAQKTGAPIIPFAVNDNYTFRSKKLFVNVGDPIYVQPDSNLTEVNEKLKDTIATLLWEIMEQELMTGKTKKEKELCKVYKKYNFDK